jgi:hypothetical protein
MRGRNADPDAYPFTSSTDKYAGLATMTDIGGFIVVIQMVVGLTDGGEEIYSKPLMVVLGPPVVPLQPDSGVAAFERADLGLTEGTMSPSETLWPKERLYPLAVPLMRAMRPWAFDNLKKELEQSKNSILCAHEPFKLLSPVFIPTQHEVVGTDAENEFPFLVSTDGGCNPINRLSEHDKASFAMATSVSPEKLEAIRSISFCCGRLLRDLTFGISTSLIP